MLSQQVSVFSLVNSAVNVTLPAFVGECCAAAPLLLVAGARLCRSVCPASDALSSKPAARRSGCRVSNDGTDRRTDGRPTVT